MANTATGKSVVVRVCAVPLPWLSHAPASRRHFPSVCKRDYPKGVLRMSAQRRSGAPGRCAGHGFRTGRRLRAALVAGVLLALVTVVGSGQSTAGDAPSLEQLVRAAMARDPALAQRQLEVRNRQLGVTRRAAGKGFGLGLTLSAPEGPTGLVGFTLTDIGGANEFDARYGINTSLIANLPHPFGTVSSTASIRGPLEESAEESPWDLTPVAALGLSTRVEQPLGPLLGLDASYAEDLEAAHAVVQAERGVRARVRAIARDLLQRMVAILRHRIAEQRAAHTVAELENEVVRRREVFQDNEQSHRFQTLLFNLERERRGLETTQRQLRQDRVTFEELTGSGDFGRLGEVPLSLPPPEQAERAPQVVDATVDLRASEHRIREDANSHWPEVTFNAGYDWRENTLSTGVGFNLVLPLVDGGLQRIKDEELSNARRAAELAGTAARRGFADALVDAERSIRDLDYRAWEHSERTRLAALRVAETRAALEAGVVIPSDLRQAELEQELLALEEEILRAERWLLKLDLDALIDSDPLNFAPGR